MVERASDKPDPFIDFFKAPEVKKISDALLKRMWAERQRTDAILQRLGLRGPG